jgi:SPP1 gp7 family putative phage head morphogenesis protein
VVVTGKHIVAGAVKTANDELLNRAIMHAIRIERLKTNEARVLLRFLDREVLPDVVAKLAAGMRKIKGRGFASVRTKQLRDLVASLDKITAKGLGEARKVTAARLEKIALTEAEWQTGLLDQVLSPVGIDVVLPTVGFARTVVNSQPFQGKQLSKWFSDLARSTQNDLERQLKIGLIEGESIPELTRRIVGTRAVPGETFAQVRRNATAITRTATNHVVSQAREQVYKDNEDVMKGVEWVSTLDARTTEICMSLDTKVFPVDEGPRPPAHMNCRSTTVPVLKSWKELGINLKEPPPGRRAATFERDGRRLTGTVPESMSYGQWLKRQSASLQNEALGPTRARLFRQGKVKIDRFVDDRRNPLTLEQLRKREGLSVKDIEVKRVARSTA